MALGQNENILSAIVRDFKSSSQHFVLQHQVFVPGVMSCSLCQRTESGLAIITPRVALIQISQGDRVERKQQKSVRCRKGL